MLIGKCHCAAVTLEIPRKPAMLTQCNCSICVRYGTLWCYFALGTVKLSGPVDSYAWGEETMDFLRCKTCGCVMGWRDRPKVKDRRMGVNARDFDAAVMKGVRLFKLDNAETGIFLP